LSSLYTVPSCPSLAGPGLGVGRLAREAPLRPPHDDPHGQLLAVRGVPRAGHAEDARGVRHVVQGRVDGFPQCLHYFLGLGDGHRLCQQPVRVASVPGVHDDARRQRVEAVELREGLLPATRERLPIDIEPQGRGHLDGIGFPALGRSGRGAEVAVVGLGRQWRQFLQRQTMEALLDLPVLDGPELQEARSAFEDDPEEPQRFGCVSCVVHGFTWLNFVHSTPAVHGHPPQQATARSPTVSGNARRSPTIHVAGKHDVEGDAGELLSRKIRVRRSSANADLPHIVSIRVGSAGGGTVLALSLALLPFSIVLAEPRL